MVTEARAFALARRGLHVLDGGLAALQELLLHRIETFGGERRRRLEPIGVVMRRGRAVGLQVQPARRDDWLPLAPLGGLVGVAASDAGTVSAPGAAPGRDRPPCGWAAIATPCRCIVAPEAVPAGTPARLLAIADPSRPLIEDNAIAVTVGRPGPREPDRIPLWIECAVPAHLVDAGPSYLRALRGRLLQTLERLWPGLAKNTLLVASPYDGLGAQRSGDGPATPANTGSKTAVTVVPPPLVFACGEPAPSMSAGCRTPPA